MIKISKAINSLYPNAQFVIENEDYERIRWIANQPENFATLEELEAEAARLEQVDLTNSYRQQRKYQYPNTADQLDMLWHAIDSGSLDKNSEFYTTLKAVKDANPKP